VLGAQQVMLMQRSVFSGWRVDAASLHAPLTDVDGSDLAFMESWSGILGQVELAEPDFAITADLTKAERKTLTYRGARNIDGVEYPGCTIRSGWDQAWRELKTAYNARPDLAGRTVLQADVVNTAWLLLGAPPQ
jgi:hypothetical protein